MPKKLPAKLQSTFVDLCNEYGKNNILKFVNAVPELDHSCLKSKKKDCNSDEQTSPSEDSPPKPPKKKRTLTEEQKAKMKAGKARKKELAKEVTPEHVECPEP